MEIERGGEEQTEEKSNEVSQSRSQNGSWWGSWGQDWIATVKEKSSVTLNMVKKDLNEFVEVIQGDTADKLSETATKLENENEAEEPKKDERMEATAKVVKQGISKILHSVSELISIEPDDSTEEIITLGDEKLFSSNYDRIKEKFHFIQTNPGTYCNEPEGTFDDWLDTFVLEEHKQDMSDLLVQNPSVRAIYTQLVPNVVSHTVFWQRYFYQIFLLEVEERKRQEIIERAKNMKVKDDTEDDDGWGDDDEDDGEIEILSKDSARKIQSSSDTEASSNVLNNSQDDPVSAVTKNENKTIEKTSVYKELDQLIKPESTNKSVREEKNKNTDNETNVDMIDSSKSVSPKPIDKSHDTIYSEDDFSTTNTTQTSQDNMKINNFKFSPKQTIAVETVPSAAMKNLKVDQSDMSSVSSWMSIDDDIKIKKTLGEVIVKNDSKDNSEGKNSDGSSAVLVNKSDADDLDEFDLDLEDDVNDEELQKMVQEIKNKSITGNLQDDEDDDWENWE